MRRPPAAVAWTWHALVRLVLLALCAVLVVAVLVPRVTGATAYTVLTGSMRPGLPPGTLVVVRPGPADGHDVGVGTVVTYQLASGEPTVVTHRVVRVAIDGRGERRFVTQGDANDIPDALPVRPEQIRGRLWYAVPYLGYVNSALTAGQRRHATQLLALLLLVYALRKLTARSAPAGRHVRAPA